MGENKKIDLNIYCESLLKANEKIKELISGLMADNFSESFKILNNAISNLKVENEYVETSKRIMENWSTYNEQYKSAFNERFDSLKNIFDKLNSIAIINIKNNQRYISLIQELNDKLEFNPLIIFDEFKYDNYNYILFGKNGAGKTSLLNKLQSDFAPNNSVVTPATRDISYSNTQLFQANEINLHTALKDKVSGKTMFLLARCVIEKELLERRQGLCDEQIITNKIARIFDVLGLDRKIVFTEKSEIELITNDSINYSLSNGSDGERTIIYFIMVTLLSPKNSYLFIDEPENHLHGAVMKKLFDSLELERPDLKFIYATHHINFIETRRNIKLVHLEKINKVNEWKFKEISNIKDLPLEIILDIEGTNDNVLFCEGEENRSLDIKLYSLLLPDLQIVSSNGCEQVKYQTIIFNKNKKVLRKKAFGILDNDFKSNEEIIALKNDNIFILKVNEIENAYILDFCLEAVKEQVCCNKNIDDIKKEVIEIILHKIENIKNDFATKKYRELHFKNNFKSTVNIEEELNRLNQNNSDIFIDLFKKYCDKLDSAIKNTDYNLLMELVPGKSLVEPVAKLLGINWENYKNVLFKLIETDSNLKDKINNTIFDDFKIFYK